MGTAGYLVPTVEIDDLIVRGMIVLLLINNTLVTVVVVVGHMELALTIKIPLLVAYLGRVSFWNLQYTCLWSPLGPVITVCVCGVCVGCGGRKI